ncbi:MAG: cardiolipin synthase [Sphaerochaetaceae bacterium]
MRKLLKFITGRLFLSTVLIIFQVGVLAYVITSTSHNALWMQLFSAMSIIMTVVMLSKDENPAYKIGWMLIFMVFPLYGGVFYILFGNKKFTSRISFKRESFYQAYNQGLKNVPKNEDAVWKVLAARDTDLGKQEQYLESISGFPVCQNTAVKFYPLGEDWFVDMIEEVRKAKSFILLEFFIIEEGELWDLLLEVLLQKRWEGVEVRLMFDDLGAIQHIPNHYERKLRSLGLQVVAFNPLKPHLNIRMNCRDHRKVLVIDGNVGFTGGVNLSDEYANRKILFGHWKDYAVRLEGDAVWNLTLMFMQLWVYSTSEELDFSRFIPTRKALSDGFVQPFGDNPLDDNNVAENAYIQIIGMAKKYVWITTPYLALDNEMITVLRICAQSNVDVRIVIPHIPDKWYAFSVSRSYYRSLIAAGVKIYEYTPGFIHAKTIISDDKVAILGTINMDYRTFYLDFENGVAFYQCSIVKEICSDLSAVFEVSHQVTEEEVRNTSLPRRLLRSVLKLTSPLI